MERLVKVLVFSLCYLCFIKSVEDNRVHRVLIVPRNEQTNEGEKKSNNIICACQYPLITFPRETK
jgi:hypothetical protein